MKIDKFFFMVIVPIGMLLLCILSFLMCSSYTYESDEYPEVTKTQVESVRVGMEKAKVDKKLGPGNEDFIEDEDGRKYTSWYQSIHNDVFKLVYIEYDVNNKVKFILY
ncbi:hypothetical protein JOD82_001836 [Paenibacillus sp. 1182]|uniref:hypothetical protein n=1 Tax=Paenibacillus sp. 1182 TaxID=2806565 RepID=UPI001AE52D4D|nr:hypothetical protein [Paenibacillus sp. 1182]MBP1308816.1 hypothetical protein [Paenibacillus sp. 1182]